MQMDDNDGEKYTKLWMVATASLIVVIRLSSPEQDEYAPIPGLVVISVLIGRAENAP